MTQKFINNFRTTLALPLDSNIATSTMTLAAGDAGVIPYINAVDYYLFTLKEVVGGITNTEIVKAIGLAGDIVTIDRTWPETNSFPFSAGAEVIISVTARAMEVAIYDIDRIDNTVNQQGVDISALQGLPTADDIVSSILINQNGDVLTNGTNVLSK